MKLDYSIKDYGERKKCVENALSELNGPPSQQYFEYMADYLLFTGDSGSTKSEREKEYPVVTKNREVTVSKRQVSYEEIAEASDYGDDVINNIAVNDKNRIMDAKRKVTAKDIEKVPGLKENNEIIEKLKQQMRDAEGMRKYSLKQQIISNYQEQYVLMESHAGGAGQKAAVMPDNMNCQIPDACVYIDENGYPYTDEDAHSLLNPKFVTILLHNYGDLCENAEMDLESDLSLILMDLNRLIEKALLPEYPILYDVFQWKSHKHTNETIMNMAYDKYRAQHSEQYYSTLWNHRIPLLIAKQAQKEWVMRHHNEIGFTQYKICSRCGMTKLKHPMFFSPNSSSADGYYTICKKCRTKAGETKCL